MAALTLTAGARPVFLSDNYFNRFADLNSDLTLSSGGTLRHRLYDMDPDARWQSVGSDDTITETLLAGLWVPGAQTSRSADYFAVMNHNLKEFTISRSNDNGISFTTVQAETVEDEPRTRISASSPVSLDKLRITMLKTQTANQEKKIGDVIVALANFQAAQPLFSFTPEPPRMGHKTAMMYDGSIRRAHIYRSDASFHFWAAELVFLVSDSDEHERFRDLCLGHDPFLFMPEPGDRPNDIWRCQVRPGSFSDNYITKSRSGGRRVRFIVEEVGGA